MQDWLKWIIGPIVTCILAGLTGMMERLRRKQQVQAEQQDALKDLMLALTYDRITDVYIACENKKYADLHDREKMEVLYTPYRKLGGNGVGTDCRDKLLSMPSEPPKAAI